MTHPFELSLVQKRQATLIYHFASLEYLQGLLPRIESLIQYADYLLDRRKVVEPFMYSQQWGARNTGANWSSTAYPAIADFRQGILESIALRPQQAYRGTGVGFCSRMLSEYSMMWMSPEQEKSFKERFEEVARYAGEIDGVLGRQTPKGDFSFWVTWERQKALFPRLPHRHCGALRSGATAHGCLCSHRRPSRGAPVWLDGRYARGIPHWSAQ